MDRVQALIALLITLVLGVLSRVVVTGFVLFDKYLGDALYTAAIFWVLRVAWPSKPVRWTTLWALGLSLAVEIFQITGIPAHMRDSGSIVLRIVSIVLGTEFSLWDILAYGVGALGCYWVARLLGNRARLNE